MLKTVYKPDVKSKHFEYESMFPKSIEDISQDYPDDGFVDLHSVLSVLDMGS